MNNTIKISATFMFTDIVGYSTLINKDQTLALELLQKHNDILMPAIENNEGKIIKRSFMKVLLIPLILLIIYLQI